MTPFSIDARIEAAIESVTPPSVLNGSLLHLSHCLCGANVTATLLLPGGERGAYTALPFTACDNTACDQPAGWDRVDGLTADAAEEYLDAIVTQLTGDGTQV